MTLLTVHSILVVVVVVVVVVIVASSSMIIVDTLTETTSVSAFTITTTSTSSNVQSKWLPKSTVAVAKRTSFISSLSSSSSSSFQPRHLWSHSNAINVVSPSPQTSALMSTSAGTDTGTATTTTTSSTTNSTYDASSSHVEQEQESTSTFYRHYPSSKTQLLRGEFVITYLEINGYLITTSNGVTVLIDPILDGNLDFGIPELYRASKKSLPSYGLLESLPPIDCLLLTQGLDDHAHVRTLTKLVQSNKLNPNVTVLAPPSARQALLDSHVLTTKTKYNIGFLNHGDQWTIVPNKYDSSNDGGSSSSSRRSDGLTIKATKGALVGPPWQKRENGYLLTVNDGGETTIYIEPHVEFDPNELQRLGPVDVVISPIEGQQIASVFDLVFPTDRSVQLVETLRPKVIIPMMNGNIDSSGPVSAIVSTTGSERDFREKIESSQKLSKTTHIQNLIPGQDEVVKTK